MNVLPPPYAVFSIFALIVKAAILWRNRFVLQSYRFSFKFLLVALFGLNVTELISFYYSGVDQMAYVILVMYYLFVLTTAATLAQISSNVAGFTGRYILPFILVVLTTSVGGILVPGVVLDGVEHIGYTYTRIAGPHYWLFQVTYLSLIAFTAISLMIGSWGSKDVDVRRKSKALLLALTPLLMVAVGVVVAMQIGVEITGTIFGSFAILFFLVTLWTTENEIVSHGVSESTPHRLFRLLAAFPATSEFQLANRVRRSVAKNSRYNLESILRSYEKTIIEEALAKCDGNRSAAAKMLGISRTTLRRKLDASEP